MNTPASTFSLSDPLEPLKTEKAPKRLLGLFGLNHSTALMVARQICERAEARTVTSPHSLAIADLARSGRERVEWTGAGAAGGTGGGNPETSGRERSVRVSGTERSRGGSAERTGKDESPTADWEEGAFAVTARAEELFGPKESRPGPVAEARTHWRSEVERPGQSAEGGTEKLFAPLVPEAADAGWHRAKLRAYGYEFGLGGLPSVALRRIQENDTREAGGRPAPLLVQLTRPEPTTTQTR